MLTQEIDLEATREDSNFSNQEKVDVVGLDKAQGRIRGFEGEHNRDSARGLGHHLGHLATTL